MTERLYYDDPLLTEFDARVTGVRETETGWEIALDRSAFYPESGGQPGDTGGLTAEDGTIVRVTDTQCDGGGEVWHTVSGALPAGSRVRGRIDWERRRDHMEQHGGEHLLAGAVWRYLKGTTIGLHTGGEDATIDVTMPDGRCHLTQEETELLETVVNEEIRMDVPVRCWFPAPEELSNVPLRKPPAVKEHVRVVAYGDFEYCACGGTHPPRSGMIGQLKILGVTPSKGKARIRFVCGGRAEAWFRRCSRTVRELSDTLSCGMETLPDAVKRLTEETARLKRQIDAQNRLLAAGWIQKSVENRTGLGGGLHLCRLEVPWTDRQLPIECVSGMLDEAGRVVLCVSKGEGEKNYILASADDVSLPLNELVRKVPGLRGGGKAHFVQGKMTGAGAEECLTALIREAAGGC